MPGFTKAITANLENFIWVTANAWMNAQLIKTNSYGVEILIDGYPELVTGYTVSGSVHDEYWYQDNAHGKSLVCLNTGMDSHEAVRLHQGSLRNIDGAFPWGGAIIDHGIIVGVSGFKEDEDILLARTILNRLVMLLNREGEAILAEARERGEHWSGGDPSVDDYRFTRTVADS